MPPLLCFFSAPPPPPLATLAPKVSRDDKETTISLGKGHFSAQSLASSFTWHCSIDCSGLHTALPWLYGYSWGPNETIQLDLSSLLHKNRSECDTHHTNKNTDFRSETQSRCTPSHDYPGDGELLEVHLGLDTGCIPTLSCCS